MRLFFLIFLITVNALAATSEEWLVEVKPGFEKKLSFLSPSIRLLSTGRHFVSKVKINKEYWIKHIEPNRIYKLTSYPNDPFFSKNWSYKNIGQLSPLGDIGKAGADIHILPLWEKGFTGNKNIQVAILDSGIDRNHPDLKYNMWINQKEIPNNGIDDDENGYIDDYFGWDFVHNKNDPNDELGHGTHCAGIIGARGNDNFGITGINWQSSLMAVRAFDENGYGELANIVEAIHYAKIMGAKIINASWGGDPYSEILKGAILDLENNGILFIAAAGNDSMDNDEIPFYPASYKLNNIISVAATDNKDDLANFSHYGKNSVHIAAPGVAIFSTVLQNDYDAYSGTSMAAPHIAGAAALLWSIFPNENYQQIKKRILDGADPTYTLKRKTMAHGRLNLWNSYLGIRSPDADPDESLFLKMPKVLESAHPYLSQDRTKWEISLPAAKFIRVHFSKIEVEEGFDKIQIKKSDGTIIEEVSFNSNDYTSEPVPGDKIIVQMKSDLSLEKWGFKIDHIEWVK